MISGKFSKVGITKVASEALSRLSVHDAEEYRRRHPNRPRNAVFLLLIAATLVGWGVWELVAYLT